MQPEVDDDEHAGERERAARHLAASAPLAKKRGRSPSRPSDGAELGERGQVGVHHAERDDGGDDRDEHRTDSGRGGLDEIEERHLAARPRGRRAPPTVDELQRQVGGADDHDRDRRRERDGAPRVAELARDVGADLPAGERPHEQADRDPDTPPAVAAGTARSCDASTAGNVTATTTTTTVMSRPVSTNCTHPATRTPNRLATNGGTKNAKPMMRHRRAVDPEHGDDVLAAEHRDAPGAPTHTPKKNQ